MRKTLTNLFWVLVGTAHFWWPWIWGKLRWFLDAIAVAKLPEDIDHLFGPVSMSGSNLIVLAIMLAGLYLTNREFWHSLFSDRTPRKMSIPIIGMIASGILFVGFLLWHLKGIPGDSVSQTNLERNAPTPVAPPPIIERPVTAPNPVPPRERRYPPDHARKLIEGLEPIYNLLYATLRTQSLPDYFRMWRDHRREISRPSSRAPGYVAPTVKETIESLRAQTKEFTEPLDKINTALGTAYNNNPLYRDEIASIMNGIYLDTESSDLFTDYSGLLAYIETTDKMDGQAEALLQRYHDKIAARIRTHYQTMSNIMRQLQAMIGKLRESL